MTKRQMVAQLKAEDFKLLADAAEAGVGSAGKAIGLKLELSTKHLRQVKRAVKILRAVKAAQ